MIVIPRTYTLIHVDRIIMEPNEEFTFKANSSSRAVGTIYTAGFTAPVVNGSWEPIVPHFDWRPREAWGGWKNAQAADGEVTLRAGPEGARWVCLSLLKDAQGRLAHRHVTPLVLNGTDYVPAETAFVVGRGDVVVGSQAGAEGNYFQPRFKGTAVTGNGVLLLVR